MQSHSSLRSASILLLSALLAGASLGCSAGGDRRGGAGAGGGGADADGGTGPAPRRDGAPPPAAMEDQCTKMDILFVIDDSGSMGEEQANLTSNFPRFVEVLDNYRTAAGTPLDYRIGVTTTGRPITTKITFPPSFPLPPMETMEDGPNGALVENPDCGMSKPWIEKGDGDVTSTFSCVAEVGTMGASIEMPLLMTERAVKDRVADGSNAGFLREDALLAVVVLTDENDCSREDDVIEVEVPDPLGGGAMMAADTCDPTAPAILPLDRFTASLDSVKGERGRWAMAVIAGPGPGECMSSFGSAQEATRLKDFLSLAGDNTVFSSICEGDLSVSLMEAIETFDAACQTFPPLI